MSDGGEGYPRTTIVVGGTSDGWWVSQGGALLRRQSFVKDSFTADKWRLMKPTPDQKHIERESKRESDVCTWQSVAANIEDDGKC